MKELKFSFQISQLLRQITKFLKIMNNYAHKFFFILFVQKLDFFSLIWGINEALFGQGPIS